jgi:8-oxo-dGTP diphosphatase
MDHIKVTCAIIERGDDVLVVQRGAHMKLPLKWEFPGGKIEDGETEAECITREIREELSIDIELMGRLTPVTHEYPFITVRLIPFRARYIGGTVKLLEHQQLLFLPPAKLLALDWVAADLPIVEEYVTLWR